MKDDEVEFFFFILLGFGGIVLGCSGGYLSVRFPNRFVDDDQMFWQHACRYRFHDLFSTQVPLGTERSINHVRYPVFRGGGSAVRSRVRHQHQEVAEAGAGAAGAEARVRNLSQQQARRAPLGGARPQERPLRAPCSGASAGCNRESPPASLYFRELILPSYPWFLGPDAKSGPFLY